MKYTALLAAILLLASCQSTPTPDRMTTEKLAALICRCAQPIVSYNDELRALAAADNMGALSQKMAQGDKIMQSAFNCITDQIEQNPKDLLNQSLYQSIDEVCHLDKRIATDLIQKVSDFEIPSY